MSFGVSVSNPKSLFGFDVLATLGRGARSTIYAVKDDRQQVYALKHVVKQDRSDRRFLDQALADHNAASQFEHPNLRRSFRVIRHRKLMRTREIALLMEFVDGLTFHEAKVKDLTHACQAFNQVAAGLQKMHESGWVHADIKPNNILITEQGLVKIIDFGQSCPAGTIKERIQGTPDYIAPEQVQREPITPRTDIFNLGATMYWVLTGRHVPTMIPKGQPGLTLKSDATCPSPREIDPRVPPALSGLATSCIQHRPIDRPETMVQVCSRIEIALTQLQRDG